MGRKTYFPTFIRVLKKICVYYTRYRETIKAESNGTVDALLDEFDEICHELLAQMSIPTSPDA